ncbi:carbohydrate ABC transporter permease, partial [Sphaerisporangium melleum]
MKHQTQTPAAPAAGDRRRRATVPPPRAGRRAAVRPRPSGQWAAWAFLAPVVIYLLVFYAYPLYRNLDLSLRDYTVRSFVQGGAPFTGSANYVKIFADPTFGPALWHTAVFTVVSLVFQFVIGLALAVFFAKNFRLSATLRALFLVPWLLPLIVSSSTWSWMLNSDSGLVNAVLGAFGVDPVNWLTSPDWSLWSVTIANIWIGIPFNLVVLYSGLQAIPAQVYEAAELDGAVGWQRFRKVTLPLLRPVSAITLLLGLVYTLKVFDII